MAGAGRSRPPTASYSRSGQIKGLAILPVSWQPGGDEITILKLRRQAIAASHADVIESLYATAGWSGAIRPALAPLANRGCGGAGLTPACELDPRQLSTDVCPPRW